MTTRQNLFISNKATMISLTFIMSLGMIGCSGSRPENLGIKNGQLSPCPDSPNCVASQISEGSHSIKALPYNESKNEAQRRLLEIIENMPRTKIATKQENYWHVEFTTRWMGFVDDVEFFFLDTEPTIHVRSASRLGKSDFGVNRERIEIIRSRFEGEI